VQVALDLAPRRVGGLDDPRARRAQLRRARRLDLAPRSASSAARRSVMSNSAPSIHSRPPARDELAAVEHPADLAVGAHDPVLERERLARSARLATPRSTRRGRRVDDAHQRPLALAMKFAAG
jgi:hypothetical protein